MTQPTRVTSPRPSLWCCPGLFDRSDMPGWKRRIDDDAAAHAEARAEEYIDPSTGRQVQQDETGIVVWMEDEVPEYVWLPAACCHA